MKNKRTVLAVLCAVTLVGVLAAAHARRTQPVGSFHWVQRDDMVIWSQYQGTIHSVREQPVFSQLSQRASVTHLVEEGTLVEPGDLLVRFDQVEMERQISELEKEQVLASATLQSLEQAEIPLAIADLESELQEARMKHRREDALYRNTLQLQEKDLVAVFEVEQQRLKLDGVAKQMARIEQRIKVNGEIVHPLQLRRSRAALASAELKLEIARDQMSNALIHATSSGMIVYQPLHIDGEFRTIREGDSVFRNQKFMIVADMDHLEVTCQVPEAQLSHVSVGNPVVLTPMAFPHLRLEGIVYRVGTMAHAVAGKPSWQRFFTVRVRLDGGHERLRSGMSVYAQILSYRQDNALVVPRGYVDWEQDKPYCLVRAGSRDVERRNVELGASNAELFEIVAGVNEGDLLSRPSD